MKLRGAQKKWVWSVSDHSGIGDSGARKSKKFLPDVVEGKEDGSGGREAAGPGVVESGAPARRWVRTQEAGSQPR